MLQHLPLPRNGPLMELKLLWLQAGEDNSVGTRLAWKAELWRWENACVSVQALEMLRLCCPDFVTFLYLYEDLQSQFIHHRAVYQQLVSYLTSRNYFADVSPLSAYHLEKQLVHIYQS